MFFIASIFIIFYFKTNNEVTNRITPAFIKDGELQFLRRDNSLITTINIEIANNDQNRTQGLMWRKSLPENSGMLFIFDAEKQLSFWMKNTLIPLDIIYVNKLEEIIAIHNNTVPLSEISIPSKIPAQFVVEVNAGFCNNNMININDKIKFEKL